MSFTLLALTFALSAVAQEPAPRNDACALPAALRGALQSRFGSSRVLTAADLYEDERTLFRADHPGACPGLRTGRYFSRQERPSTAIILMGVGPKKEVRLIVARPAMAGWTFHEVEVMDEGSTAVVWREGPGTYKDPYADKTKKTANDVVVLTGYESWQRVYIWNGRAFEFLQTSD